MKARSVLTFAEWGLASALAAGCACAPADEPARNEPRRVAEPARLELFEWERGIALRSLAEHEPLAMYLWFYEWRLFDAVERGEWTAARHDWPRGVSRDGKSAWIAAEMLRLEARVDGEAVELELVANNTSGHDWPEHASIIACFNPGPPETQPFEMGHHKSTYFVGPEGLERLADRDFHFRSELRAGLEHLAPELEFAFTKRWSTAERDDHGGMLVRSSQSERWSCGVAWQDWLGVQAHNPWLCMHVATRVGPLARGESRRVRGRLVLLEGSREAALERLRAPWNRSGEQDRNSSQGAR